MPAVLVCHDLSYSFPTGETVLDGLTATFTDGFTGLVGRNGAGKSTLIKLLAGALVPISGSVERPDRIGYLPQDLVLAADRSVASVLGIEPILTALATVDAGNGTPEQFETIGDNWDLEDRVGAELAAFGFDDLDLGRPIGTLSGGQVVLLALAGHFLTRPEVLLLDEPTNNLDHSARDRLYQAVRRWPGPVIAVSHDRELLALCDQIAELRDSVITFYGGTFSDYTDAVAVEQEAAARAVRSAEADLKRQKRELIEAQTKMDRHNRYGKEFAEKSGMPAIMAGAMKRKAEVSQGKLRGGHQADVEEARQRLATAEERVRDDDQVRVDLSATAVPGGREIVITEDLVLRNGVTVDLHIRGPERLALTGGNGTGKATFIDTILGAVPPRSGGVRAYVPIRLLPQRLRILDPDLPVITSVSRLAPSADDNTLRSRLARFRLGAQVITRPARTLSGGELFRASLAGLLLAEPAPQLLILDEPTNNLDLDTVAALTSALQQYRGALLVASHDRPFLDEIGLTGEITFASDPEPGRFARIEALAASDQQNVGESEDDQSSDSANQMPSTR
ncbi:ABC transporter [Microlunatus endophyticus]|uniref:ABC transporter n=1 Tax=Microlunatus endophyticus TaxID=1716077 RepID=A0A917SA95_9ACTN|nr:ABC-F family ATP-binding cassette domain-containing protein [Microlunatus endophyticus]GGL66981.1 ABC transporter [Microlunatus endophyticus]